MTIKELLEKIEDNIMVFIYYNDNGGLCVEYLDTMLTEEDYRPFIEDEVLSFSIHPFGTIDSITDNLNDVEMAISINDR